MVSASRFQTLTSGRFELRSRIGKGAVGVVYDAFDLERGTRVALKALRTVSPEHILSLKNEFRAVQDLQHPNLVNLGELFEDDGQWFFTMEYVEGRNFLQYVCDQAAEPSGAAFANDSAKRDSRPGVHVCDEIKLRAALAQLVRGVDALHAAKKVHRDIKPSNILVSDEGRVVLLDFGVAGDLVRSGAHVNDGMVGTVPYMAPEQVLAEALTPATDWYAVGTLLYQALTGELPFTGSGDDILEQKVVAEAPAPSALVPSIPHDLDALCTDLLRMDPEARPGGAEILSRLGIAPDGQDLSRTSDGTLFVGRRRELSELERAFDDVQRGAAVSLVLHGESGVGKSHLVQTFTERLVRAHPDAIVFKGRCYERESVPYKAVDGVVDGLAAFLRDQTEETVVELLPDGAGLLAQVFPVLADLRPVAPSSIFGGEIANPQELRLRGFAVLRRLLLRLAARGPLLLVIDDLQWADADSLTLLAELLRPPAAPPLLLLATERVSTEIRRRAPSEALARPELPGDVRHLRVEQLPREDAERLIVQLLGNEPANDADIRAIADETRGHPLFIDELVRQRSRRGADAIPLKLDEALWARVRRVDPAGRRLLELVSVAGIPISQETAAHAAAIDLGQFFYLASVLRASHLARTTGAGRDDTIEAYHDRVRESVLAHVDAPTRTDWHSRLAIALERSGKGDPEALAIHWQGAGNAARAADYAELAGDQASRALAFERAVRLYELALELRRRESGAELKVMMKLADALTNAGHGARAAETRIELARSAGPIEALDLRRRAAEQFLCSGHFDRGIVLLRSVLVATGARFPHSPLSVLFSLLIVRVLLRLRGLAFEERDAAALDRAELVRIDATRSAGAGFAMSDNILGAYFQTKNLLLALRAGDPARILHALAMEVSFTSAGGETTRARARRLLASAQALAERVKTPDAAGMVAVATGYTHFFVGEWKDAKLWLDRAEHVLRDRCVGMTFEVNSARALLYRTMCNLGALKELAARVPAAMREVEQQGDIHSDVNLRTSALVLLGFAADEPERVRAELARAQQHLARSRFLIQHYFCLVGQAQLHLYLGEGQAAHTLMTQSWSALKRSLLLRIQAIRIVAIDQRARAAIMAAVASPSRREALLHAAERDAARLASEHVTWGTALSDMLRASIADAQGNVAEAASRLARASAGFDAVDMALHAAAARRRHGELVGGTEGSALIATAEAWAADQNVRNSARMFRMLAPHGRAG